MLETDKDMPILSVIGYGSSPNTGMRKGSVVRIDEVVDAVVQAITEAERVSGVHVPRATVNVNSSQVIGMNSRGVIAISAANREITSEDRYRVEEAATIVKLPPNRDIIQIFAKNYRLDGQDNIKDPVGMQGVRLEVDTHIVTGSIPYMRNINLVLEKSNVSSREIINVTLEDGTPVLFYKSSGANVATTGKQAGEWFVIPGFAENGWFFKTKETIALTKGVNKYLTDMATFLKQNGSNGLGVR